MPLIDFLIQEGSALHTTFQINGRFPARPAGGNAVYLLL